MPQTFIIKSYPWINTNTISLHHIHLSDWCKRTVVVIHSQTQQRVHADGGGLSVKHIRKINIQLDFPTAAAASNLINVCWFVFPPQCLLIWSDVHNIYRMITPGKIWISFLSAAGFTNRVRGQREEFIIQIEGMKMKPSWLQCWSRLFIEIFSELMGSAMRCSLPPPHYISAPWSMCYLLTWLLVRGQKQPTQLFLIQ